MLPVDTFATRCAGEWLSWLEIATNSHLIVIVHFQYTPFMLESYSPGGGMMLENVHCLHYVFFFKKNIQYRCTTVSTLGRLYNTSIREEHQMPRVTVPQVEYFKYRYVLLLYIVLLPRLHINASNNYIQAFLPFIKPLRSRQIC